MAMLGTFMENNLGNRLSFIPENHTNIVLITQKKKPIPSMWQKKK